MLNKLVGLNSDLLGRTKHSFKEVKEILANIKETDNDINNSTK